MFDYAETQKSTMEHFNNPQKGDLFTEMYSFWMYVWDIRLDGTIITHEASAPCTFPKDAQVKTHKNAQEWRDRFSYGGHMPGKFSVRYVQTGTYHAPECEHDSSAMFNLLARS